MATDMGSVEEVDRQWAFPFGGIRYEVDFPNKEDLVTAVNLLLSEPTHLHNFAVKTDGFTLHVSATGLRCLRRLLHDA